MVRRHALLGAFVFVLGVCAASTFLVRVAAL